MSTSKTPLGGNVSDTSKNHKCYVVGGGYEYIKLMWNLGCDGAKSLDDSDFVLFTGGEDVNPEMYGEPIMAKTMFSRARDAKEEAIFHAALDKGLPMVGICRGGQILNVLNNGKMWQHVTGHTRPHVARIEVPPFVNGNRRRTIEVTSTHHQMMIPTSSAFVLMTASEALEKHAPALSQMGKKHGEEDIEVVFYDDTNCLCFQPHPELASAKPELVDFFEECLDNYIYPHVPSKMERAILAQVPATKDAKKASSKKKGK